MTKEEAEALKPGDIIGGAGYPRRVLTRCWIERDYLYWHQEDKGNTEHCYLYENMDLVQVDRVINNYPIY